MLRLRRRVRMAAWGAIAALSVGTPSGPAGGSVIGDTVSPIETTVTAYCGSIPIEISYRNTWIDGNPAVGIQSLSVDRHPVAGGPSAIRRAIGNVRISGISFAYCYADRGEFLIAVVIDDGDAARLKIPAKHLFVVSRDAVKPA